MNTPHDKEIEQLAFEQHGDLTIEEMRAAIARTEGDEIVQRMLKRVLYDELNRLLEQHGGR